MNPNLIIPPGAFDLARTSPTGDQRATTMTHHHQNLPLTKEQDMKQRRELDNYAAHLEQEFNLVDANHDGTLTHKELDNFFIAKVSPP